VHRIARHSDAKITLKIYAHRNLQAMRDALAKIDEWLE
jgi:integrase